MQINVITQSVGVEETLGACTAEQPIDADITLPDYCPDIRRVLKCLVTPRITAVQTAGDRATADGSAATGSHSSAWRASWLPRSCSIRTP